MRTERGMKEAQRLRDIDDYYSENPSPEMQKRIAEVRATHTALVEAPCWLCHTEGELGHPPKLSVVLDVIRVGARFTTNLCETHEVDLAAKLIKAD